MSVPGGHGCSPLPLLQPPGHTQPLSSVPRGSPSPESCLQASGRCLRVKPGACEEQDLAAEKKRLQVPRPERKSPE